MRPARGAGWALILSLIGAGVSGYLYVLHLGLLRGELLGGAACGTGAFNCHAVTAGAWGSFLGAPLALWGLLGYLAVFALALLAQQSPEWAQAALTLIAFLATAFLAVDAALLALMAFVIRHYCLFCMMTYAVNALLLVVAVRSLGRPWPLIVGEAGKALAALRPSRQRPAASLFWGLVLVAVAAAAGVEAATTFVSRGTLGGTRAQLREFISKQHPSRIDTSSDPMIGPPQAPLQIVEFSDFFCPACQRASQMNTIIMAGHRRDAVFVFKHYPLDTSCNSAIQRMVHPNACAIAAASECAHRQGKFWAFHDLVFEQGHAYNAAGLDQDLARLGVDLAQFRACMDAGQGVEAVKRDIAEASRWGVSSTPTYLINGISVTGGMTPSVFEEFVAVLRESHGGS